MEMLSIYLFSTIPLCVDTYFQKQRYTVPQQFFLQTQETLMSLQKNPKTLKKYSGLVESPCRYLLLPVEMATNPGIYSRPHSTDSERYWLIAVVGVGIKARTGFVLEKDSS